MASQQVQCEPAVLRAAIVPAAVIAGTTSIVLSTVTVEIHPRVRYVEPQWPAVDSHAKQNVFVYLPVFRGPPRRVRSRRTISPRLSDYGGILASE
jgi:hypothetical protein